MELWRLGYAAKADDFGQDAGEQAELVQQLESTAGSAFGEDTGELVADALRADLVDVCGLAADSGDVQVEVEARAEADGAQHAELVFGVAQFWIADGADDSAGEIFAAADIIERGGGGIAGGLVGDGG